MTTERAIEVLEVLLTGDGWDSETKQALDKAIEVMGGESKQHYARELIFELRARHSITVGVYLHWLDKLNKEEFQ